MGLRLIKKEVVWKGLYGLHFKIIKQIWWDTIDKKTITDFSLERTFSFKNLSKNNEDWYLGCYETYEEARKVLKKIIKLEND